MRAGETDKAVSFKDPVLFELIERFVRETGFKGQVDIDVFNIGGEYYISEVNPRFGGGYPHAYESGCDHIELIVNNLDGVANKPRIGEYDEGIVMMKYNEIMMLRDSGMRVLFLSQSPMESGTPAYTPISLGRSPSTVTPFTLSRRERGARACPPSSHTRTGSISSASRSATSPRPT